jgi:hypothetical protein
VTAIPQNAVVFAANGNGGGRAITAAGPTPAAAADTNLRSGIWLASTPVNAWYSAAVMI